MTAAGAAQKSRRPFSSRAFLRGLSVGVILYGLLALWIFLSADRTLERHQERLASQTVIVEWQGIDEEEHNATAEAYGPVMQQGQPSPDAVAQNPEDEAVSDPVLLDSGLADTPVEGLYEQTPDGGHLPVVRAKDGLTPFQAYRRPFDVNATSNPVVSIAVTGLGLSDVATESAVRTLPPNISFILSPYAAAPDFWVRESRAQGHEIWLSLPLETDAYPQDDPGPHTMLISAPEKENLAKLDWLLSRADGYAGFVTGPNPAFMASAGDMRPVIGAIYHRGLGFVDGSADPSLIPHTMAVGMKTPYSVVDIWIDSPDPSQDSIARALEQLEAKARDKGFAVGVIHALPVSYQQVMKWVETLPQKGLSLAPLSATTGL